MFLTTIIVSALLAAAMCFAAGRKLTHRPEVVETYVRVGVPEEKLDYLAWILIAGAAGLILGLLWAPVGIAAAIGVVLYFGLAIAAHIRADDAENLPTPVAIEAMAVAALILRVATL